MRGLQAEGQLLGGEKAGNKRTDCGTRSGVEVEDEEGTRDHGDGVSARERIQCQRYKVTVLQVARRSRTMAASKLHCMRARRTVRVSRRGRDTVASEWRDTAESKKGQISNGVTEKKRPLVN